MQRMGGNDVEMKDDLNYLSLLLKYFIFCISGQWDYITNV